MSILGLSLFNANNEIITEDITIDLSEFDSVQPTTESLHEIYMEAAIDFSNLKAATVVADVIVSESAFVHGEENAVALLENAITDMLTKLKDGVVKLWKKVKAWFLKMIENVKIFFMSGDKFIKEFESVIKSKNLKDFEYTTYAFKDGKSKIDSMIAKVDQERSAALKDLGSLVQRAKDADSDENWDKLTSNYDALLDKIEVSSDGKIDDVVSDHMGMKSGKVEIKDFAKGLSKDQMIAMVKDGKKTTADIEQQRRDTDDAFKDLVAKIDKAAGDKGLNPAVASRIRTYSSYITKCGTLANKIFSAYVDNRKTMYNESLRVLKAYMSYRGSKEDKLKAAGVSESATFGIFDGSVL